MIIARRAACALLPVEDQAREIDRVETIDARLRLAGVVVGDTDLQLPIRS